MFYFLSCRHLSDKYADFEQLNAKAQSSKDSTVPKPDYKLNYQSKLVFGLLLRDFNDTVKEGDGKHLIDLYKIALLLYFSENTQNMPMLSLFYFRTILRDMKN